MTSVPDAKVSSKDCKEKDQKEDEDLSDEDLALKTQLEIYVEIVQESDPKLLKTALESMRKEIQSFSAKKKRKEIQSATSSVTSVPKTLEFLRPHYGTLKDHYEKMDDSDLKKFFADILSVLAFKYSDDGKKASLEYRLSGSDDDIGSWGHEYVRNLAEAILQEYAEKRIKAPIDNLMELVDKIVAFQMQHNAETDTVDLLMEVENLPLLAKHVDETNFRRTCLYLTSRARYLPEPDDLKTVKIAYGIYKSFEEFPRALQMALYLKSNKYIIEILSSCNDALQKKQLCYIIARHGITFMLDVDVATDDEERWELQEIIYNYKLREGYLTLARDVEVMDPKSPEDIYKAHLPDDWASAGTSVISARQKLAATFVNAFVNAGFGQDNMMTVPSEASSGSSSTNWVFMNEGHGKTSAAASLGMIGLWDVGFRLEQLFKYSNSEDIAVAAGGLLGIGIVNCGVVTIRDSEAFFALEANVNKDNPYIRIGAIMGVGLAYAGSLDEMPQKLLGSVLKDKTAPLDVIAFTAISMGLISVGSCDKDIESLIMSVFKSLSESELGDPLARLVPLGLGLLYLEKRTEVKAILEDFENFNEKIREYSQTILLSCAYAGSGNELKVEHFQGKCLQSVEKCETSQGAAVLGIALVEMTKEVRLATAPIERLLQYGDKNVRKAIPLALSLLYISNPEVTVTDTLSKLSHDSDSEVAMAAIISLGLIGAGTNNARISDRLHKLSNYYYRNADILFCVRIAQGLVQMGKGLLTLKPYHSERFLLSPTVLGGLITFLHVCLDMETIVLGKYPYVLYFLVLAIQPKMLMTVDENLKPLSVPVRVGAVGQSDRHKTNLGFQTRSTPLLLSIGERVELATKKYIPLSSILEGFVILKENPDWREG